jgi:hypothetical protein
LAAVAVLGAAVMMLWNALLPGLFGWRSLNFPQALGLLLLCRILFGRFGRGGPPGPWQRGMGERWQQMTPEEREKLRARGWGRCGRGRDDTPPAA